MRYQDAEQFKSLCGYVINGTWYPRVTKILDVKAKPGLEMFFKEVESFSSAQDVKNKSAVEGSLVHKFVELAIRGETADIPEEIHPAIDAFEKFRRERNILFHPEFVERQVWSSRYRYAGTIDALATIGGKFGVLDIKTSAGFYPEYNLQTAAYTLALEELETKKALAIPRDIETRWILRIDQKRVCQKCGATLREKGGRNKIRNPKSEIRNNFEFRDSNFALCAEGAHEWGELVGEVELREFPRSLKDMRAFIAAKILWEWENEYWLKQIGYLT